MYDVATAIHQMMTHRMGAKLSKTLISHASKRQAARLQVPGVPYTRQLHYEGPRRKTQCLTMWGAKLHGWVDGYQ